MPDAIDQKLQYGFSGIKSRLFTSGKRKKQLLTTCILFLFVKDAIAQITFQKTYGGVNDEFVYSIGQTSDGGYIIAGSTRSFGAGNEDIYLTRINSTGDTLWTRTFGGADYEYANSAEQTSDGGFIIAATTDNLSTSDIYLLRTDSSGNFIWAKTYGGSGFDFGNSVQQTNDGGFIVAGLTRSFGAGMYDAYLIRTDAQGDTLWTKTYGGIDNESGKYSVRQTSDSGFIISGGTQSFGAGNTDAYIIRTNSLGDTLWTKAYGGTANDYVYAIIQTADSGFVFAGSTSSFGAGVYNIYLTKTNSLGNVAWTKTFGGNGFDGGGYFRQTADGGFILTGAYNPPTTQDYDVYLIRADSSGNLIWAKTYGGTQADLGYDVEQTNDDGYIIAGMSRSFGLGASDTYLIRTDSLGNTGCNQTNYPTITNTAFMQVESPAAMISSGGIINVPSVIPGSGVLFTTLCSTVGTNEISMGGSFHIYPNPSRGNFTIEFERTVIKGNLEIVNILGVPVNTGITENILNKLKKEITLTNISNGIYFVKIDTGQEQHIEKLIIQ
ncbi:MAG TPA: T9SS type A sorting domain-containing protein [Bacteroidia bacterium]|nr:T9SS type A sorting domain-containing protein [Bacteroidia bacterium]